MNTEIIFRAPTSYFPCKHSTKTVLTMDVYFALNIKASFNLLYKTYDLDCMFVYFVKMT